MSSLLPALSHFHFGSETGLGLFLRLTGPEDANADGLIKMVSIPICEWRHPKTRMKCWEKGICGRRYCSKSQEPGFKFKREQRNRAVDLSAAIINSITFGTCLTSSGLSGTAGHYYSYGRAKTVSLQTSGVVQTEWWCTWISTPCLISGETFQSEEIISHQKILGEKQKER